MDGVIINSEPYWRIAEITCFKLVDIHLTEEDCLKTIGYRIDEVIDFWYQQFPWNNISKKDLEKRIIDQMVEYVKSDGRPLPGILDTLSLLKGAGVPIGVASSSPLRLIQAVLEALNIRSYFDVISSAETEDYGKPHPAVFINCAKKMGLSSDNCLIIEDSPAGVIAGLAAKARVIAVPENHLKSHPIMEVTFKKLNSMEDFSLDLLR